MEVNQYNYSPMEQFLHYVMEKTPDLALVASIFPKDMTSFHIDENGKFTITYATVQSGTFNNRLIGKGTLEVSETCTGQIDTIKKTMILGKNCFKATAEITILKCQKKVTLECNAIQVLKTVGGKGTQYKITGCGANFFTQFLSGSRETWDHEVIDSQIQWK